MYKIIDSPCINLKQNFNPYPISQFINTQMEQDIFNFINLIRQNPSKLNPYLRNIQILNNIDNEEIDNLINFVHNLSTKNISFQPLIQNDELTKISYDLLNYIINIKEKEGRIKYDLLENRDINLRNRSAPYLTIKGKYYEGIILEGSNLLEIIGYILKDIKGRNVLFNEKIKYISIACGYIENPNNIYNNKKRGKFCTIIDLVQDFEKNYLINNNDNYLTNKNYKKNKTIFKKIDPTLYKDNIKEKIIRNNYNDSKSFSYDKITKRRVRRKKFNNKLIKDNTFDEIFLGKNSPLSNIDEEIKLINNIKKQPKIQTCINKLDYKDITQNLSKVIKTTQNIDLNKIYKNNSFYCSKYEKNKDKPLKTEEKEKDKNKEKEKEKKDFDTTSENNCISSASFSKQKNKKKLKPEEKLELLRKINKESRDKSKKKKTATKTEDDNKSVSFSIKKNISNDVSFSDLTSLDNDKKPKINISKLKSELKQELKNEVKEELKRELKNKIDFDNNIKIPLLNLFLNQNDVMNNNNKNNNDISNDLGQSIKNNNRDTKGLENYNNTNRSTNSIDIFLPPNKNITTIDNDKIPGLININSNISNNDKRISSNETKKENTIIKKFVKLDGIKNKNKRNKTPLLANSSPRGSFNNYSPKIRNKNFVYHKVPFANKNIYCNRIRKKNQINFNKANNKNILSSLVNSPNSIKKQLQSTFKKIIVKNTNNNISKGQNTTIDKIIKIPKNFVNNLNYIDNNSIIINNKTNNIVYIKQTSPNRMKTYKISNIYKQN